MAKMVSVSSYNTASVGGRKPLGKVSPLVNSFSLIDYSKKLRFLIMDCPSDGTIHLYLKEFARLNVTDVVRVCQPTYTKERVESCNVQVHDLPFKDGDVPPSNVLKRWVELVNTRLNSAMAADPVGKKTAEPTTIAVHCVAGLGRAPVLVAVALIEKGMDPLDAIEHVRHKRRGAFNNKQIAYLGNEYKRLSGSKGAASKISVIRSSPHNSTGSANSTAEAAAMQAGSGALTATVADTAESARSSAAPSPVPSGIHRLFFKKMFGSH
ncbi:hypothetical protein GGF46_004374 [Coemansia sp. RSA 552]|nr:hypothetical protein GGF46_004374 [Coemansia sp. RSA 552]